MLQANYPTKKALQASVGKPLNYTETSLFGREYQPNGQMNMCDQKRKWYATVTTKDGVIVRVK